MGERPGTRIDEGRGDSRPSREKGGGLAKST